MYKLAARVVWSMRASKSTLAHAKKIYSCENGIFHAAEWRTYGNNLFGRDIVGLFVESFGWDVTRIARADVPAVLFGLYRRHGC